MEMAKGNKLGTMPINKLIVNVSLPIVVSMLVQALYNVVDSIFVSMISENALAAVSLVFPIQNLVIGVGVGTGVGINSLLSRRLGEKDFKGANKVAGNGLFLSLINFLVFAAVGIFFTDIFFNSYRSNPEFGNDIANMGTSYMRIVTTGSLGVFVAITGERLLQASGRSSLSMVAQLAGAVANIVLDPIFIFGLGPIPAMGVAGAAIATVIGQWLSMFISIILNLRLNKDIKLSFKYIKPSIATIKQIYIVGVPSIIMQSIGSIMVYGINQILVPFGSTPLTFFGIYFKLQSFVFMPVFGFNGGLVSITAYNYGAKNKDRIVETVKAGLKICISIMIAGMILFMLIPGPLLSLFNADARLMAIGKPALGIISLCFPLAAVSIVFTGVFQALGIGVYSMVMSMVRQLVFLLPLAWLLARFGGLDSVWYAFPLAEISGLVLSILFYRHTWNRYIKNLKPEDSSHEPIPDN